MMADVEERQIADGPTSHLSAAQVLEGDAFTDAIEAEN